MDNENLRLKDLFAMISRRRRIVVRIVAVAVVLAGIYNVLAAPVYQANVSVKVNARGATEAAGSMGGGSTGQNFEDQQIKLLTTAELVKSRAVLEGVIDELYQDVPKEQRPSYEGLQAAVNVAPVKSTTILNISVLAYSPEDAQKVANTLVKIFMQRMTELARAEGKDARAFIGERLAEAKRNLEKVEQAMVAYKKDKKTISVDNQSKIFLERQGTLKRIEVENQLAVRAANAKLADVGSQLARQKPGFVADNALIQQYKNKLADQEAELVVARSNYSEIHPKVAALQAAVAETRRKLNAETARVVRAEAPSSNPVYQSMLQTRIQAETEVAVAHAQQQAIAAAQAQNEAEIKSFPDKEQGLVRLLRDYTVAEEAYTMLAKKYDQARVDEVMQPSNVQVVDMASLPLRPVRPRPVFNIVIAVCVGLLLGTMTALAVDFLHKTVDTAEDVKRYMGLPVIGSIPRHVLFKPQKKVTWWQKLFGSRRAKSREVHYG